MSVLRVGVQALCFLAALLLLSAGLDHLFAYPDIPEITEKLVWYEQHRATVDTVVIGSSRVYRQIRPDLFDEAMSRRGMESFSMNMGAPSMKAPEMGYLLRRMLDPDRPNPSRVFIAVESRTLTDVIQEDNVGTSRVVYWHDLPATLFAIEQLRRFHDESFVDLGSEELRKQILLHVRMWLLDRFNVSQGVTAVRQAVSGRGRPLTRPTLEMDRYRGFSPLTDDGGALSKRRRRFLRKLDDFERRVQRKSRRYRQPPTGELDPSLVQVLDRLASIVRDVGAEPVFFVAPNPAVDSRWMDQIAKLGIAGAVFVYDDPNRYPGLYEADHYFDLGHLNDEGARLLTEQLVADYADWKLRERTDQEAAGP